MINKLAYAHAPHFIHELYIERPKIIKNSHFMTKINKNLAKIKKFVLVSIFLWYYVSFLSESS